MIKYIEVDPRVKHLNDLHKVDKETMKIMGTQNRKQRGYQGKYENY